MSDFIHSTWEASSSLRSGWGARMGCEVQGVGGDEGEGIGIGMENEKRLFFKK